MSATGCEGSAPFPLFRVLHLYTHGEYEASTHATCAEAAKVALATPRRDKSVAVAHGDERYSIEDLIELGYGEAA